MQNKEEKVRKWKNLIKNYMANHKYLKDVGKAWILDERKSMDTEQRLKEALIHTDKSLNAIKEYFEPYLEVSFIDYRCTVDKLNFEIETMEKEIEHLKRLDEDNKVLIEQINHENFRLRSKVVQLETLQEEGVNDDNLQPVIKRKQEQFEEAFKIQNDLIAHLNEQLAQNDKKTETLKLLNTNLKRELDQMYENLKGEDNKIVSYPKLPL